MDLSHPFSTVGSSFLIREDSGSVGGESTIDERIGTGIRTSVKKQEFLKQALYHNLITT